MIKRTLHKLMGYKVEIKYAGGGTEIVRAHLCFDCTVRVLLYGFKQGYLEPNGIVRGLGTIGLTTWKAMEET